MSTYPIGYQADFALERSRLTVFFRYFLAIPHLILAMLYGIALMVTTFIAWFAILFTARFPAGLYSFGAGGQRYLGRVNAYVRLITDAYPPFDGGEHPEYPVRITIAPALESYSRAQGVLPLRPGHPGDPDRLRAEHPRRHRRDPQLDRDRDHGQAEQGPAGRAEPRHGVRDPRVGPTTC